MVAGIPVCQDARVDKIRLYACPDGSDGAGWYRIAELDNSGANGLTAYTDTTVESALTTLAPYPGPTQPAQDGTVQITVYRDGQVWFVTFIPVDFAHSNIIPGAALGPLSAGSQLTVDVLNNSGSIDLKLTIH